MARAKTRRSRTKIAKRKKTKKGAGVVWMPATALKYMKEATKSFQKGLLLIAKASNEVAKNRKRK